MGSCLSGDNARPSSCAQDDETERLFARKSGSYNNSRRKIIQSSPSASSSSSSDSKLEMVLHRIPGRMLLNGSTDSASLFTKQGKKGANQDAMIVWENFCSKQNTIFCGVFDGHGPNGHMVARKVRDSLPLKLNAQWELDATTTTGLTDVNSSPMGDGDQGNHSNFSIKLRESLLKAYKVMDKELKLHPYLDCYCSGTTAVTLVKQGHDIVIGNIGDSRAVLGTRNEDGSLVAVQLTEDLKPNLPMEAARIKRCKGRVFALQNEPEVARVWLPNCNSPGLAMARAFGDFCLKGFGLISVPEVYHRHLTDEDEFVVLATDGVWDVLSNKEVVDIVASASRPYAAKALVESAVRAWRSKYPSSKVDDCAVVCLFLDSDKVSIQNEKCSYESVVSEQHSGVSETCHKNLPP